MSGNAPWNFRDLIPARLRREPGKVAVLSVLLMTMALLWARAMSGGGAAPAAARPARAVQAAAPATAQKSVDTFRDLEQWVRQPVVAPIRDLFAIDLRQFPLAGGGGAAEVTAEAGFWDEVAKSLSAQADQENARRILVENLRAQASKLELRSTLISGGTARALVNDRLVGEGDTIAGFRVVSVEARRIVVERDGVKLEVLAKFAN